MAPLPYPNIIIRIIRTKRSKIHKRYVIRSTPDTTPHSPKSIRETWYEHKILRSVSIRSVLQVDIITYQVQVVLSKARSNDIVVS